MGHLRYSPAARAALENITRDVLANNGRVVAERVVARLRKSLATLALFPGTGRKRPRLGRDLRSWPVRPWVAFYRIVGEDIEIVRIIHGKRRISRTLIEANET